MAGSGPTDAKELSLVRAEGRGGAWRCRQWLLLLLLPTAAVAAGWAAGLGAGLPMGCQWPWHPARGMR